MKEALIDVRKNSNKQMSWLNENNATSTMVRNDCCSCEGKNTPTTKHTVSNNDMWELCVACPVIVTATVAFSTLTLTQPAVRLSTGHRDWLVPVLSHLRYRSYQYSTSINGNQYGTFLSSLSLYCKCTSIDILIQDWLQHSRVIRR
jgi:hypothetical protein